MTGPETDLVAAHIGRAEERQAADMVEMRVGIEEIGADRPVLEQGAAELAQPGAAIHDQQVIAAPYLDAGGVAAITNGLRAGAGNAAPHAPEPNGNFAR